jgi:hypothetical protein
MLYYMLTQIDLFCALHHINNDQGLSGGGAANGLVGVGLKFKGCLNFLKYILNCIKKYLKNLMTLGSCPHCPMG